MLSMPTRTDRSFQIRFGKEETRPTVTRHDPVPLRPHVERLDGILPAEVEELRGALRGEPRTVRIARVLLALADQCAALSDRLDRLETHADTASCATGNNAD